MYNCLLLKLTWTKAKIIGCFLAENFIIIFVWDKQAPRRLSQNSPYALQSSGPMTYSSSRVCIQNNRMQKAFLNCCIQVSFLRKSDFIFSGPSSEESSIDLE